MISHDELRFLYFSSHKNYFVTADLFKSYYLKNDLIMIKFNFFDQVIRVKGIKKI